MISVITNQARNQAIAGWGAQPVAGGTFSPSTPPNAIMYFVNQK